MPSSYLEVSLTVDGEMAEAVAEVLARFAPGGVVIESTQILADSSLLLLESGEGQVEGPLRAYAFVPVDSELEDKRQRLRESLWYLGRIKPLPEPQFKIIEETDWSEAWKKHYRPVLIGEKLQIVPAWLDPPDPHRVTVKIDPGMAFGTGTHPTTQMCLQSIEHFFRDNTHYKIRNAPSDQRGLPRDQRGLPTERSPRVVIDLGCGSAILSIAALKLGAENALGVDIDSQALESARKNAELNSISSRLELGSGSLADILAGSFSIQQAPLVLANILAPIIVRLLDGGLGQLLSPGGVLVLSGILEEQAVEVIAALEKNNLRLSRTRQIDDWIALEAQK